MNEWKQRSEESEVVLRNYTATMRDFNRGPDSIMTASTFPERPPSPSPKISLLECSIGSYPSTRTTNIQQVGPGTSTLDSRSTYQTAPTYQSTGRETQIELSADPTTNERSMSTTKSPTSDSWIPGQCPQIFVKGLGRTTIVLRPTMIPWTPDELKRMLQDITSIPEEDITILKDGRILKGFVEHDENNCTLMANVKAARAMTHLEQLEEDELRKTLTSVFDPRSSTLGDVSLESLQRRETAKQKLYTSYLGARRVMRL